MVARNTTKKTQYEHREQGDTPVTPSLEDRLEAAYKRIDELLQANNEYLERARAAEQLAYQRLTGLTGQAMIIGQLGTELAMTQEDD